MAISQIVDDQIKQLRKERAELDELRVFLERKEKEMEARGAGDDVGDSQFSGSRKEQLLLEIEALTAETKRLRSERNLSIESFGGELSKVHAEKTAESAAQVKKLQSEINFLLKGKADLEAEIALLKENLADLEQTKKIEWGKVEAEISRHKAAHEAELDETREKFLAELDAEKKAFKDELRANGRKERAEISAEKREWEKEILKFEAEKQKILDDIKLLAYEFEKAKSENILVAEKARVDGAKLIAAERAAAEVELETLRAERMKDIDEARLARLREIETMRQEHLAGLEAAFLAKSEDFERMRARRLDECCDEIQAAQIKFEKLQAEIRELEVKLEMLTSEMDEILTEKAAAELATKKALEAAEAAEQRAAESEQKAIDAAEAAEKKVTEAAKNAAEAAARRFTDEPVKKNTRKAPEAPEQTGDEPIPVRRRRIRVAEDASSQT